MSQAEPRSLAWLPLQLQSTTGASPTHRQRNPASVLTPLVNEILDAETAERDAFAQFADIGHRLGRCHCLGGHDGGFLLGEGFQGAGYYLFGRVVAAGAEVRRHELLAVRVEGQGESHGSV